MALKIESAEDLIAQHAPGHAACGAPGIKWAKDNSAVNVTCLCGFVLSLGFDFLASEALDALETKPVAKTTKRHRAVTK